MPIQRLHTEKRYSEIVIHNGTVYLAGQLADDYAGDIAEQTRQTLANIDRLLAEAGSDKSKILSATIWLADINDFGAMNSVWDAWVDTANPPARATGESRLASPDYKVEIIVIAAKA